MKLSGFSALEDYSGYRIILQGFFLQIAFLSLSPDVGGENTVFSGRYAHFPQISPQLFPL